MRRYEQGKARPTRSALRRLALIYGKPPTRLDPGCPHETAIVGPSHMDSVLRIYLKLKPDFNAESTIAITKFILFALQHQ